MPERSRGAAAMTDEFDRLNEYVASLPPATPEGLASARTHLDDAIDQEIAIGPQVPSKSYRRPWDVRVTSPPSRSRRLVLVLGLAALLTVAVVLPTVMGHRPDSGRSASSGHTQSKILVKLV